MENQFVLSKKWQKEDPLASITYTCLHAVSKGKTYIVDPSFHSQNFSLTLADQSSKERNGRGNYHPVVLDI